MKRIFIIIAAALLTVGAQAQSNQYSNYLGLNIGGGLGNMAYSPDGGKQNIGLGFTTDVQFIHFFGKHFGFGLGLKYTQDHASAVYNTNYRSNNTYTHPANHYNYNPVYKFNNWTERQTMHIASLPIELFYRATLNDTWGFLAGLGLQFDVPLTASYETVKGTYTLGGYFPATNVEYYDLPSYGFTTYKAEEEGSVDMTKRGMSLVADLGLNHELSNHWGLYIGCYAGLGLSNLYNPNNHSKDFMVINDKDATAIDYNSTIASDRIDNLRIVNAGIKIGINFGWNSGELDNNNLDRTEIISNEYVNNGANPTETVAEDPAVAEENRCNALRMNDPDLRRAVSSIDADIAEAEQIANESGSTKAKTKIASAKAKANEAKNANKNGQYCKAYDLMNEAYGLLADSYAAIADKYADESGLQGARDAANDAATYAEASHKGGIEAAIAAKRIAKFKADQNKQNAAKTNDDYGYNYPSTGYTPANMTEIQKNIDLINTEVHFAYNSTVPLFDNNTDLALRALAAAMAADKNLKVMCVGHTDSIGSDAGNMTLGLRRADALKYVLVGYGAPASNVGTDTRGKTEPVAPNDTDKNRYLNRRAVIIKL